MSVPAALGRPSISLSPPRRELKQGANALTAPTSPGKRLPVVDKSRVDPQLLRAAQGMESMFLDHMMKVMRDTVPKSEMSLDNKATEIYQGMMDSEFAQTAARTGGVGLADQIIAYMQAQRYTGRQEHAAPAQTSAVNRSSTGGTHEGQSAE